MPDKKKINDSERQTKMCNDSEIQTKKWSTTLNAKWKIALDIEMNVWKTTLNTKLEM